MAEQQQQSVIGAELEALVYQRLYPELHFQQCAAAGCHVDGRAAETPRAATIAVGSNPTADGSALIKLGDTTVLALVRLEVMIPSEDTPDHGAFQLAVELSPIAYPDARRGKVPPVVPVITQVLTDTLGKPTVFDPSQLCISSSQAVWVAYLDIYVLNACGSLIDACLLAAVAALRNTRLPAVHVTEEGNVERDADSSSSSAAAEGQPLELACTPLGLTVGLFQQQQYADPDHVEEEQVDSSVTIVVNEQQLVMGVYKPGGSCVASSLQLAQCINAAQQRHGELLQQLEEALAAAEAGAAAGMDVEDE